MPLPIESPAPKASSLIKRFQQTIDNSDEKPVPLLPKQRLSVDPEDPAHRRRSWAVGSGGAGLPQTEVIWKGRQTSAGSSNSISPPHSTPKLPALSSDPSKPDHSSPPTPSLPASLSTPFELSLPVPPVVATPPTPVDQSTPVSHGSNIPPHISLDTSSQLIPSQLYLTQSDHQPIPAAKASKTTLERSKSTTTPSTTETLDSRPKAAVSADIIRTSRTRKATNITAPTAASLAKIRSSETSHIAPSMARSASTHTVRHEALSIKGNSSTAAKPIRVKPDSIIGDHRSDLLTKKSSITRKPTSPLTQGPKSAISFPADTPPSQSVDLIPGLPASPSFSILPRVRAVSIAPKARPRSDSAASTAARAIPVRIVSAAGPRLKTPAQIPPFGAGPGLRVRDNKSPTPKKSRNITPNPTPPVAKVPKASIHPNPHLNPKHDSRPTQRARVASIATPISRKPHIATKTSANALETTTLNIAGAAKTSTGKTATKSKKTESSVRTHEAPFLVSTKMRTPTHRTSHISLASPKPEVSKSLPGLEVADNLTDHINESHTSSQASEKSASVTGTGGSPTATQSVPATVGSCPLDPVQAVEKLDMNASSDIADDIATQYSTNNSITTTSAEQDDVDEPTALSPRDTEIILAREESQKLAMLPSDVRHDQSPPALDQVSRPIHISNPSSGSIVESLGQVEHKKAVKRRSGVAVW